MNLCRNQGGQLLCDQTFASDTQGKPATMATEPQKKTNPAPTDETNSHGKILGESSIKLVIHKNIVRGYDFDDLFHLFIKLQKAPLIDHSLFFS